MTTYTVAVNDINKAIDMVTRLSVDDQLALLWYVYTQMGEQVTPAAPGAASPDIAQGLFAQVKEKTFDEQLDIQRDLVRKADTLIGREYGALSPNTKLAFWYYLAQGMETETIIPMPENYQLSDEGKDLLAAIETMDFEEQITVLRNTVNRMGAEPRTGAKL